MTKEKERLQGGREQEKGDGKGELMKEKARLQGGRVEQHALAEDVNETEEGRRKEKKKKKQIKLLQWLHAQSTFIRRTSERILGAFS